MSKCELSDCGNFVTPCDALESILEYGHGTTKAKGVYHREYTNMETGKPSRGMVLVKSGEHKKAGIIFSFCPMCGELIFKQESEE